MLRVYDATARYVDQGGGKRKGAFAIYLEPWHADVFEFLELKKNHGKEEARARDLFYAMWVPDLFMKRVEANGEWSSLHRLLSALLTYLLLLASTSLQATGPSSVPTSAPAWSTRMEQGRTWCMPTPCPSHYE